MSIKYCKKLGHWNKVYKTSFLDWSFNFCMYSMKIYRHMYFYILNPFIMHVFYIMVIQTSYGYKSVQRVLVCLQVEINTDFFLFILNTNIYEKIYKPWLFRPFSKVIYTNIDKFVSSFFFHEYKLFAIFQKQYNFFQWKCHCCSVFNQEWKKL